VRLNLGCGPGPVLANSYIHMDASRKLIIAKIPILAKLIRRYSKSEIFWDKNVKFKNILRLRLRPNSIEFIYSSHLLEHLYFDQSKDLLRNLFESLQVGGKIRLALPDYHAFISNYILTTQTNPVLAIQELEDSLLSQPLEKPKLLKKLWNLITGDLHVHRWHPTFALVESMLLEVGFRNIVKCNFRESQLAEIHLLENREFMTFYIEGIK
jgi:SAM-dependent methyltransferase